MRSLVLALAFSATLASFGAAAAQDGDDTRTEIFVSYGPWLPDEDCSPTDAAPVQLVQIISAPETFMGQCVSVDALWSGGLAFRDLDGYYLSGPLISSLDARSADHRIGVYASEEAWLTAPERPTPARLIGTIGDCSQLYNPDVIMVTGYCHYTGGTYLAVSHAELTGAPAARLTNAADRQRVGNLSPAPADWAHRAHAQQLATEWLAMVRTGDVAAYEARESLGIRVDLEDLESDAYEIFRSGASVFARLRSANEPRMEIFEQAFGDRDEWPEGDYGATACFCLERDCSDRWPISQADANNSPDRPFACVAVGRSTWQEATEDQVRTPYYVYGRLVEPTP